MSSNDYANRLSSQPPLSRHLPVPWERPINGGSTVEVSPDFAFCMTIIRDFSKPCLTKNVFFTWKGTYWRIPCGNNSERLGIWQCMQGDSCRAFLLVPEWITTWRISALEIYWTAFSFFVFVFFIFKSWGLTSWNSPPLWNVNSQVGPTKKS